MKSNHIVMKLAIVSTVSAVLAFTASDAFAAGSHGGGHGHSGASPIGKAGKAADVSRTINVKMHDNYYEPKQFNVKGGETIRFVIKNAGQFVHEFNIGTKDMHKAHDKEMMMMVEHGALEPDRINHDKMKMDMGRGMTMEHNDPNSVLLEPGKSAEIIWTFPKKVSTEMEFACNVPGHYDSGMVGPVNFPKSAY
ncbi:MAG: cupredoxin domain-containing protein [Rhodospirillales bacterium]|nr:cupredoxin domain-containing protein [Alphaproteobacteria bacterium]MBL6948241.1 cupredoxin domain-containing protein [Rhodospirillales bacterium]